MCLASYAAKIKIGILKNISNAKIHIYFIYPNIFLFLNAMQQCSNVAMQQCSNAAMQQCSNAAMQQCSNVAMQQCSNAAM